MYNIENKNLPNKCKICDGLCQGDYCQPCRRSAPKAKADEVIEEQEIVITLTSEKLDEFIERLKTK